VSSPPQGTTTPVERPRGVRTSRTLDNSAELVAQLKQLPLDDLQTLEKVFS
jgi:hypothetical protein